MQDEALAFDLDVYAARYKGRGKIHRMQFIARRCPSLRADALRIAIIEAKKGRDTLQYKNLIKEAAGLIGEEFELDKPWVAENDRWAAQEMDKLRRALEETRQQQNKVGMRNIHSDLGDFFHIRGRLRHARGDHIKTRDYCTRVDHTVYMCYKVIQVSIEDFDFSYIENHYLMAENTPEVDKNTPDMCNMRACAGLANMLKGQYSQAVRRFTETNCDPSEDNVAVLSQNFGDMIALEDVAVYGGLCAMATRSREELTKEVIKNPGFANLLELVPDMREVIYDFHNSRFTRCLQTMEKMRPELMLDMHLGSNEHVETLFRMIRRKAIVQYTTPFTSVKLRRMETVFNTTAEELEEELLSLIECGVIEARIDSENHELLAKTTRPRTDAIKSALQKGRDAFDEAEAMLLRMTILKFNLHLTSGTPGGMMGPRASSISSVLDNVEDRGRPLRHG
ncbi:COP9 signalosome complex subunit 1 [Gracilariopsis chorda]|uniref:COP9 signalosome complex subunit 1 n=1 Tax=Gracilariopsis chorda TaxID=448386 RepID=A0A2V3IRT4_9FLOR|nr:COP9 signalosome complex subunit 1 [Gracilariopsis chorda]|eukprot:PXF44841.1 COP9 signalosome complex subunit 1 [Gracilariopsis chorda]